MWNNFCHSILSSLSFTTSVSLRYIHMVEHNVENYRTDNSNLCLLSTDDAALTFSNVCLAHSTFPVANTVPSMLPSILDIDLNGFSMYRAQKLVKM